MSLLGLIVIIIIVVMCLWLVNRYVKEPTLKMVLEIAIVILTVIYLLSAVGIIPIGDIHFGRIR